MTLTNAILDGHKEGVERPKCPTTTCTCAIAWYLTAKSLMMKCIFKWTGLILSACEECGVQGGSAVRQTRCSLLGSAHPLQAALPLGGPPPIQLDHLQLPEIAD